MNRVKLPLSSITVSNRQRFELGDINDLAASLSAFGLIQPIVVNQDKRLIAGGRRLAAATKLGWTDIDVVFRETLTDEELHTLELEENIRRLDMAWQEKTLGIARIHSLKSMSAAMESKRWGQRETGAMLGVTEAHINYNLLIAKQLASEIDGDNKPRANARYWKCESFFAAWKLLLRDKEDALTAEINARQQETLLDSAAEQVDQQIVADVTAASLSDEVLEFEREKYYSNPHNEPGSFEDYWKEKLARAEAIRNTIYISQRLVHSDSISFMLANPAKFDHIITDIPYGIDVSNMQQNSGAMVDIDTIEELHDVDYNTDLIADFFPAAFDATKEHAFVITWCDQMMWQFMYDSAIDAGFAVQRWPITWVKTHACINNCAGFNTTKNTEIAIVCRKKGTTVAFQPQTSVITCGRDELCDKISHPFAKPFAAWEFLIKLASIQGETILEPFAGRGSGVLSLIECGRNFVAVERDETHYNALVENVRKHYLSVNPNYTFK